MQRREQQRRAVSTGGGTSYLGGIGGGISGYAPVPRFDAPERPSRISTASPTPANSTTRAPAFKGSGMKLGSKKTKQAELLDALGGEVLASSSLLADLSSPPTPAAAASTSEPPPSEKNNGRGSIPEVEPTAVHIAIKESISAVLLREGGVQSIEVKGDMNLLVSDSSLTTIRVALAPSTDFGGSSLQFKQHPKVAKFGPGKGERIVALKDSSSNYPVNQSLAVLRWRYVGTDETCVPLSSMCIFRIGSSDLH